ncbi:MAG: PAS domain S-box protein [Nitrospirae bacterium]|nr:MAG: PAS domain S-box protein [Nitrospirota bacterium]
MIIKRNSIIGRLIIPVFLAVVLIFAALIVSFNQIANRIIEESVGHRLSGHINETMRIIEIAQTDLTTARLLDNPPVVEAKKRLVVEAISLNWQRKEVKGVIAAQDGSVLLSTFPQEDVPRLLLKHERDSPDKVHTDSGLHLQVHQYPAWGWRIIVATESMSHQMVRKEVFYLIPLMVFGSGLLLIILFIILRRNLQTPLAAMVDAVRQGREVQPVDVSEFDLIGSAINDALTHIEQRNRELAHELEERRKAELSVREKEERIRLLLESAAEGIYGVNVEGVCTFCNASCLRILGYQHERDLLGTKIHGFIHHSHADGRPYPEEECRAYQGFREGRKMHVEDEIFWRADGSNLPVEYWSYPVIREGVCIGAIVTFFDITERKQAEKVLRAEKNKSEAIIAAMGDGISIQDRDYRILYQNEVHKGLIGSHVGEHCFKAYESRETVCEGCPVALTFSDGKVHTLRRTVDLPGGTRCFEITTSPLRDAAGAINAGIEVVRDVTKQIHNEELLRQSQKMDGIGQLAGGVAHDFNNILTAIIGYASILQMRLEQDEKLRAYATDILASAERASGLTKSLLAFSRKQPVEMKRLDLNKLVGDFRGILQRLIGEDIEIVVNCSSEDLTVEVDRGQIEQVLMNLTTNARDAMPQGGRLSIDTERLLVQQEFGDLAPGSYALIMVSDTGIGMDKETVARVFEPFFTTKEVGKGTGLGLSIAYGIVSKHNGTIHVYSEPGQGTTFRIYLPLIPGAVSEDARAEAAADYRGTETILLVEDNEDTRRSTRMLLEEFGYSVIEAVDGEHAVAVFLRNREKIDLVLSDLVMPKKNGREACEEIRRLRPGMKTILMSGYTADIISQKGGLEEGLNFLPKPLTITALLKKIRSLLGS